MNYINSWNDPKKQPYTAPLTTSTTDWHQNHRQTPPAKPKPLTIADVFPRLDHWAIGFDDMFDTLRRVSASAKASSYPPYDLFKHSENQNILDIAVAGFTKSDISVTVEDGNLIICGKKDIVRGGEVLHKGIANRDFELKFALAEYWEVMSAHLHDGMLSIILGKVVPEEKKPKVIDIE